MNPIYLLVGDLNSVGNAIHTKYLTKPAIDEVIKSIVPIHNLSALRGLRNQRIYMFGDSKHLPTQQQLDVLTKLQQLEFVDINDAVAQGLAWWHAASEQAPISKWQVSKTIADLFPEHVKDAWI